MPTETLAAPNPAAAQLANRLNLMPLYVVRTAVTLDLPEALSDNPTTVELARRIHVDDQALVVLLDYLVPLGLVARTAGDRLSLTPTGDLLRKDHDTGIAKFWDMTRCATRW